MEGARTRPTEAEILERARAMLPGLHARAAEIDALRRLPDDLDRAFAAAGFYKIMQPVRYGGYEHRFGMQCELGAVLGCASGSAAWVASITSCHAWIAGMFAKPAQDEIWGESADTTLSSSFLAVAPKAERAAGGWRVSGRWKFSSGVDHCQWAIVMLPLEGRPVFALLRLAECRIEDTWRAVGLAGTGSNDIVAEDVLLPEHRILPLAATKGGPTPGSAVNPGYLYRLPALAPLTFSIVGNGLGIARGIADDVIAGLQVQKDRMGANVASHQSIQLRVAEALAEIDAAHAVVYRQRDEIVRKGEAGEDFTIADRTLCRRDLSFAGQLCLRAVERLFPILGARGLMDDHPVQRGWRDLRAVTHHIAMTWDIQGSSYGAVALGLPCPDGNF